MITLDKVSFSYRDTPVLTDVSLTLPKRGAVCFTAPSGGGKTTLLRLMAGLELPQGGTVTCEAARTAVVFQDDRLLPWLTAEQNVALVCSDKDVLPFLEAVELAEARHKYPWQLSGGMKRRVALARALAFGGDLLLLDEPFTGLDSALRARVARALRERFKGGCIVLITHLPEEAALLGATVVPLSLPLKGNIEI